jgi:hypothetical protein
MRCVDDLLVEFEYRIAGSAQMFWNFIQVGVKANAETGIFLLDLFEELRPGHRGPLIVIR